MMKKNILLIPLILLSVFVFGQNEAYLKDGYWVKTRSEGPSNPKISQVYYDIEDLSYYQWDGTSWLMIGKEYDVVPRDSLIIRDPDSPDALLYYWKGPKADFYAKLAEDPNFTENRDIYITDSIPASSGGTEYTFINGLTESGGTVSLWNTLFPSFNEVTIPTETNVVFGSFSGQYGLTIGSNSGVSGMSLAGDQINIIADDYINLQADNDVSVTGSGISLNSDGSSLNMGSDIGFNLNTSTGNYIWMHGADSLSIGSDEVLQIKTPTVQANTATIGDALVIQDIEGRVEFAPKQDPLTFTRGIQNISGTVRLGGTMTQSVSLVLNNPDSGSNFTISGAGTSGVIQLYNNIPSNLSSITTRALNAHHSADEELTLEAGQELRIRSPNVEAGTAIVGQALVLQNATTGDSEFETIPSASGLEAIDEGNGIGWRLISRNPANYGSIGGNAVDLGYSSGTSSTRGATGLYSSIGGGDDNTASGEASNISGGSANESSGSQSTVSGGLLNIASGDISNVNGGANNVASGSRSNVSGGGNNTASGDLSAVSGGTRNEAPSYGEWVGGLYSTVYTPASTSTFDAADRLFNIGNGTGTAARSDAFTIFKSGNANLNGNFTATGSTTASQFRLSSLNTAPASAGATGTTGEIRITSTHIYVCVSTNTWVRSELATW